MTRSHTYISIGLSPGNEVVKAKELTLATKGKLSSPKGGRVLAQRMMDRFLFLSDLLVTSRGNICVSWTRALK